MSSFNSRRTFLLGALAAFACSRLRSDDAVARAAKYLWSQQQADGGFHSRTYGLLRSGQSLTPFVLGTLLDVPTIVLPPPQGSIERSVEFIRANVDGEGMLGGSNSAAADYPNYATSLALTAMQKLHRDDLESLLEAMTRQLRRQQFSEQNGWSREHPAYGGWGMGGAIRRPPEPGHVDLSMTRHVLEALHASGVRESEEVMTRARVFLDRSQNQDGGFYFSPVNPEINKAGKSNGQVASYGTATADGLLALRAAGVDHGDDRIRRAITWLRANHLRDRVPGIETDGIRGFGVGLRFYYAAAISRGLPELTVELPRQNSDGSFTNAENLVKEDDPLIATTFALSYLLRLRRSD